MPLEAIYLNSVLVKNGGLSKDCIDMLARAGLCSSARTCNRIVSNAAVATWYKKAQERLLGDVNAVDPSNGSRLYKVVILRDNFFFKIFATESTRVKEFSGGVNTSTTMVRLLRYDNNDFNASPTGVHRCSPVYTVESLQEMELAVLGRESMKICDVLTKHGSTVKQPFEERQRRRDWRPFASDDQSSGSHTGSAIYMETMRIYLQSGEEEVGYCCDPQYIEQYRKFSIIDLPFMHHTYCTIPPMHMGMHGMESVLSQVMFIYLLWGPICKFTKTKPSVFNKLEEAISSLIDDQERKDAMMTTESFEYPKSCFNSGDVVEDVDQDADDEDDDVDQDDDLGEEPVLDLTELVDIEDELSASLQDCKGVLSTDVQMNRLAQNVMVLCKRYSSMKNSEYLFFKSRRGNRQKFRPKDQEEKWYNQAKDLRKSTMMSYTREWYLFQLLYSAWCIAEPELSQELRSNSLVKLIVSYLEDMVKLTVDPIIQLRCNGDIMPLYRDVAKMVTLVSLGGKPKITRCYTHLVMQVQHLIRNRPGLLRFIATNATTFDELPVEHKNGEMSKQIRRWYSFSFQQIRMRSVDVDKRREVKDSYGGSVLKLEKKDKRFKGEEEKKADIRESYVSKLSSRFLPGGSEYDNAKKLAYHLLLPMLTSCSNVVIPQNLKPVLDAHRPMLMEQACLGEHLMKNRDDVKRIMKAETTPNCAVEASEEDNSPVDPFEYYVMSKSNTMDKVLKPVFRLLKSKELITNTKMPTNKDGFLQIFKVYFLVGQSSANFASHVMQCEEGIKLFKNFCIENQIPCRDPNVPWVPGTPRKKFKEKEETCTEALERADLSFENVMRMNMELDTSKYPSIYEHRK